ncbi:LysE family translocator [Psychrobium sp. 1_MG-2023]|uniref:LysE family translocator n=1 Tax=Psychrobium sp. 1_MG-2023 TaxID=3062624 RepID=UPI000C347064|nr:LysE family translocator [Psychrobium sp. 1_MG-2023]MDP2562447.1 LysE family translocator [Psychrobium sp. 1_MG-2023]PKF56173.1 LysE family translocator [Alteromonadales bacterium alter-6D02]
MNLDTLAIYCFVSFFYIISPGPAIFLAIYNGAVNGAKCVMVSAVGNILGLMCLSALSVTGLSAILLASSTLFMAVKVIGACYLIYLGVKQIRGSRQDKNQQHALVNQPRALSSYFKEGLLVAITNPKPIIFFAALFPQFLDTTQPLPLQFIVMTFIFMAFSFLSLSTYGYLAQRAKGFLAKPNNVKWFQRITGGLFVGMGVSLFQIKNAN